MSSLYKKLLNEPSSWEVHLNVTSDYTFVVGVDASSGEITMIDCQGHPSDKKSIIIPPTAQFVLSLTLILRLVIYLPSRPLQRKAMIFLLPLI